ncbi:MAG: class I SAM-dependent methyltransferase [Rhodospirillales bacterium]|nr:class I SAM-dependent methyltransferase [Rhodospirillales bacterium]
MLLSHLLNRLIRVGSLSVVDANGKTHLFEGAPGPAFTVRLHDKSLHWRLFTNPPLALGESCTDGTLTVEGAALYDFLDFIGRNMAHVGRLSLYGTTGWADWMLRRFQQFNPAGWAKFNVAHHYDLSGDLYDLFLDSDKQYSCAYFPSPKISLEKAQEAKKRHIAAKLMVEPGQKVLDIGCGWGGMAIYLARETGADVTGLTLSKEQLLTARKRAEEAGLSHRVRFYLRDYREQTGAFDRIVSVGMFEHVGIDHFKRYFRQVHDLLTPEGVALIHTIGRFYGPGITDPWIRKYIFPGGYIPALSEIMPAIEKNFLWTTDIEVLRLHYAQTLRHWRYRFMANRDKAAALYDERFYRMWEYYLAISEVSFRHLGSTVFQIQLTKSQDTLPLTRDYMAALEASGAPKPEPRENSRAA